MTEAIAGEEWLDAIAELMERQAKVARAEVALAAARRCLGDSMARLSRLAPGQGESVVLPPAVAALLHGDEGLTLAAAAGEERTGTLRERIVALMEASPDEVFTPARLAPAIGSRNRDSIRNTLLFLAAKGLIEKLSPGQYQARRR